MAFVGLTACCRGGDCGLRWLCLFGFGGFGFGVLVVLGLGGVSHGVCLWVQVVNMVTR